MPSFVPLGQKDKERLATANAGTAVTRRLPELAIAVCVGAGNVAAALLECSVLAELVAAAKAVFICMTSIFDGKLWRWR